jgi:DNA-binding MarR family transcriptional regulator
MREIADCTCLRLRQTTRRLTQIYDAALAPAELTIGQFGVIAHLYGLRDAPERLSVGAFAEAIGTDPTTLTRLLKPLERAGLVADGPRPADRRVRTLKITSRGVAKLRAAVPLWREAQATAKKIFGAREVRALNDLLDTSVTTFHA